MADQRTRARRRRRGPDEERIVERFKRLAPQQKALQLALGRFSDDDGQFDRDRWIEGFESDDPETIVAVTSVTGLYEGLVNHLVEMLLVAAKLRGLAIVQGETRPTGPDLFRAVGEDGGLTDNQVEVLLRLYGMRNDLQHSSPGVEGGDAYEHIVLLTKTLKRFVESYIAWLKTHDVTLV